MIHFYLAKNNIEKKQSRKKNEQKKLENNKASWSVHELLPHFAAQTINDCLLSITHERKKQNNETYFCER